MCMHQCFETLRIHLQTCNNFYIYSCVSEIKFLQAWFLKLDILLLFTVDLWDLQTLLNLHDWTLHLLAN